MAATNECARKLQAAARGLLYPTEADKPVKVVSWTKDVAGEGPITAKLVRGLCRIDGGAPVRDLTLDEVFAPVTTVQDWFGAEEEKRVAGFRELECIIRELRDLRAFRFGDGTADVVVVGRDATGDLAGVRTQVVET